MFVGIYVYVYLHTHKYILNTSVHMPRPSLGGYTGNQAALVMSGKRGGDYFSLYTFYTF